MFSHWLPCFRNVSRNVINSILIVKTCLLTVFIIIILGNVHEWRPANTKNFQLPIHPLFRFVLICRPPYLDVQNAKHSPSQTNLNKLIFKLKFASNGQLRWTLIDKVGNLIAARSPHQMKSTFNVKKIKVRWKSQRRQFILDVQNRLDHSSFPCPFSSSFTGPLIHPFVWMSFIDGPLTL